MLAHYEKPQGHEVGAQNMCNPYVVAVISVLLLIKGSGSHLFLQVPLSTSMVSFHFTPQAD
jgi:hypothetical protein